MSVKAEGVKGGYNGEGNEDLGKRNGKGHCI